MPIEPTLLDRINTNDPTLVELDLSSQELNNADILQLTIALAKNTILTSLNVNYNQIGNEGAKILANNHTLTSLDISYNWIEDKGAKALANNHALISLGVSGNRIGVEGVQALAKNHALTLLDVSYNQIGDKGAKALAKNHTLTSLSVSGNGIGDEGVKALANNHTLTSLNVDYNDIGDEGAKALANNHILTSLDVTNNQIGDEGAKALANNHTLTSLTVWHNPITGEWQKKLEHALKRNQQQLPQRRDQFIRGMVILARDKAKTNPSSSSLWAQLPKEIMLHIISLMDFRSLHSIGKSAQQIYQCAQFIFDNISTLNELLEAKKGLKILEKSVNGTHRFQFFQAPSLLTAQAIAINENKGLERPNKMQKTA